MAQVTLRINGYSYTLGCKDGEERHLESMGAEVNRRIDGLRAIAGPSGESRMLMMAALLMADEIAELQSKVRALEDSGAMPMEGGMAAPVEDPELGRKLIRMAKRAEEIAESLEAH